MTLNLYGSSLLTRESYPRVENLEYGYTVGKQLEGMARQYGFRGMAAPQMGILLNLAVVDVSTFGFLILANPVITRMYGTEVFHAENCISCPPKDNGCRVARMERIDVVGLELRRVEGGRVVAEEKQWTFTGKDSRVVHHEIDHLAGTFFFERAALRDKDVVLERFQAWKHKWRSNGHHPVYEGVRQ